MKIYTDASYDEHNKTAGIGIIKCRGTKEVPISNHGRFSSVNEAELFAIYIGCVWAGGEECTIYTDSQTALSYIKGEIKEKPRTKNQYIRHMHCKFWAYKIQHFNNCKFEKVKAHTSQFRGHEFINKMADLKAKEGLGKYYYSLKQQKSR